MLFRKTLSLCFLLIIIAACSGSPNTDNTTVEQVDESLSEQTDDTASTDEGSAESDTGSDIVEETATDAESEVIAADEAPVVEDEEVITETQTTVDNTDYSLPTNIFFIYAQDGTFLGYINYNPYDSYSVCNAYSAYGSEYRSTSIFNKYGAYGSEYRSYSAFNDYALYPPIIYRNGYPFAYLTTNPYFSPYIDSYALMYLLNINGCDVSR